MPWYYWLPELLVYALTILIVRHAWTTGGLAWTATFVFGSIYGFFLEYMSVLKSHEYCYGKFMIMLPPWGCPTPGGPPCPCEDQVPLWIVCGWGVTLYITMRTSSHLDIPWFARPVVDAALAVNVDWILDPLAGELAWWTWYAKGAWFGIPYSNFCGWIVTVFSFSFLLRLLQRIVSTGITGNLRKIGIPLVAMLLAPLIVAAVMLGYPKLGIPSGLMLAVMVVICGIVVLPFIGRVTRLLPPDWLLIGIAVFFQIWYAAGLWYFGVFATHPLLVLVCVLTMIVCVFGYTWPYRFGSSSGP